VRKHEASAPHPTRSVPTPRSQDRPLAAGWRFDRHAGSNAEGACAPVNAAFNAGIAEIDAGIAEINVTIAGIARIGATIIGIADINEIKIRLRVMSLIIFGDTRMAEIIIESTAKPITANMLVRLLLAHGVTAAKIIRTQTAQESPPPRFGT
jgi:hypothetical protein